MTEEKQPYNLMMIRSGYHPKTTGAKPKKPLRQIGLKKQQENKEAKKVLGEDETIKEKWFKNRRKEMTGQCCCGCGEKSSKYDDKNFRSSICHIFPQRIFKSVQFHHLNWVERKFWATKDSSACHSIMDDTSMDKWKNMEDFDNIIEKFHILAPLLTDEERKTKFYTHLENLIYGT